MSAVTILFTNNFLNFSEEQFMKSLRMYFKSTEFMRMAGFKEKRNRQQQNLPHYKKMFNTIVDGENSSSIEHIIL